MIIVGIVGLPVEVSEGDVETVIVSSRGELVEFPQAEPQLAFSKTIF